MPTLKGFVTLASPAVAKLVAAGALPAFPAINQLNEPTSDGGPDENAADNCFIVAPTACINFLTGANLNGDEVLDSVYGEGYSGGGDSWDAPMLAFYAQHGCRLDDAQWANDSNVGDVLAYVRQQLDAGHPCVTTWPSLWGIQTRDTAGGYHAVVCIGYTPDGAGGIASYDFMNPWGGIYQTYDADWVSQRCVNAGAMWRVNMVPAGWTDDGTTITAPNGVPVRTGFADHIRQNPWEADDEPLDPEGPVAQLELSNAALGGGNQQLFRRRMLGWNQAHGVIDEWLGVELKATRGALTSAQAQVAALTAQVADLKAKLATPAPIDPTTAARAAAYEQVKAITDKVA